MRFAALVALAGLLSAAGSTHAHEVQTTCRFDRLVNHVLAPADLELGVPTAGISARVTIDPEAGRFVLHGSSIDVPPYPMPFAQGLDTMDFDDVDFEGVIDAAGHVVIPGVRFVFCTLEPQSGAVCAPSNLCEDDLSTICVRGAEDNGCAPGVRCQGICAGDHERSCAANTDCAPGDRCGGGTLVPFTITLTTATAALDQRLTSGTPVDFQTGQLFLTSLAPLPREAGLSGVSSLELTCTLTDVPSATELPSPAAVKVRQAKVRFGKGIPGAGDDGLKLTATYAPLGGMVPDLSATEITVGVGATLMVCDGSSTKPGQSCGADSDCIRNDTSPVDPKCVAQEKPLLQLVIPAGSLRGNAKGTKFKAKDTGGACSMESNAPGTACTTDLQCGRGECVRIKPLHPAPDADDQLTHKVRITSRKGTLALTINSKGLNLDALTLEALTDADGNVANVTTRVGVGALQGAAVTNAPKGKKQGVTF
jgi:hypothetical protein